MDAVVKWFNPEKGFGFVGIADGSGDAFLHVCVLQAAGHDTVQPESRLRVQVGQGLKGRQVTAVLEVDARSASPWPDGNLSPTVARTRYDPTTAFQIEGTVKWFKADKGFGFVVCDDGGKDVFLHISVVERAGLQSLAGGQRLAMKVVQTPKGREAISLSLIE